MYETFEKLPESKKKQIIQVCIEEFAKNGYANTSTNTIVKRLGISKGLLFLYFTSKKHLYLYLVEYLTDIIVDEFFQVSKTGSQLASSVVFDNLGEFYKTLLQRNPYYILFMLEAFMNTPMEIRADVNEKHEGAHNHIMEHLDTTGFRKGVDPQAVVDLLHLSSFHIGQLLLKDFSNIEDFEKEAMGKNIQTYLDMFSKCMDIIKFGVYEDRPKH